MLNAAICGMGRWGQVLIKSVQGKSDKIKFVTGISRTPSANTEFAAEYGLSVTDDYTAVSGSPDIDAIVLVSPPWLHGEQIIAAARSGQPVFIET